MKSFLISVVLLSLIYAADGQKSVKAGTDGRAPEGWSSKTNYRPADTDVRRRIVVSAIAAVSKSSGPSTTNGAWQTDCSGGDGERFRKAIWYWQNRNSIGKALRIYTDCTDSRDLKKTSRRETKRRMDGAFASMPDKGYSTDLTIAKVRNEIIARYDYNNEIDSLDLVKQLMKDALSTYVNSRKDVRDLIVQRIMSTNIEPIPHDDESTLQYLGIRKSCLEWAMTIAIQAGGKSKNFDDAEPFLEENVRPGMGLYCKSNFGGEHAMLIIDTKYDKTGKIAQLKVAESNCGRGGGCNPWTNPGGQVPWSRKVGTCELSASNLCHGLEHPSSAYLVDYDR